MQQEQSFDIAQVFGARQGFSQRWTVYVPNKDKDGESVDQDKWVKEMVSVLSNLCGGATVMPPVKGAWLNPSTGALVLEEPVLVYAFIEPVKFVSGIQKLVDTVQNMGRELNQGQVAFEFDNILYLIDF